MDFTKNTASRGRSPFRGIILVAAFGVMMLGMYFAVQRFARQYMTPGERGEDAPAAEGKSPSTPSYKGEPEPRPAKEIPSYLTDPAFLRDTVMSEGALANTAFYQLLYQMKIADLEKLRKQAEPAPPPEEIGKLPVGAPVLLEGDVVSLRVCDEYTIPAAGISSATEYEIKDARGNLYLVYAVYDVKGIDEGDHVKLAGRFFRMFGHTPSWKAELNGEGDREAGPPEKAAGTEPEPRPKKPTPVIIAWGLEAPQYLTDASVLRKVYDGTFGQEPKVFYYLVHKVQGLSQEQLKEQADGSLTPESMERFPAAARDKVVAVDGVLKQTQVIFQPPNIGEVKQLYLCILHTSGGQWVWVYTLEDPAPLALRDQVRAYGVFFKTYRYISAPPASKEVLTSLMMARRLVPLEYRSSPSIILAAMVGGCLLIVLFVAAVLFDRRSSRHVGRHVRGLAAKSRPRDIDAAARRLSSRAREAKDGQDPRPGQ